MNPGKPICIIGLGYVGLPLAVAFAKKELKVIGFDINKKRIESLIAGKDETNEVSEDELKNPNISFTTDQTKIKDSDFIIITVPTPITKDKLPDLSYLKEASRIVGNNFNKESIVVYESTVYPGATEEVCMPILEESSGLKCGIDFKIGYSPERINPGDKDHTIHKVVKIVSGMDDESREKIAEVYSKVVDTDVFKARNIKTAEAAKVIENIQRDLNIALMNELSLIFSKIGINTQDVLEAAETKWNFHKYTPGLVGGHCIGIDPYYLTYKAKELGYNPRVILAGREINDSMSHHIVKLAEESLKEKNKVLNGSKILLLGLTFKENVKDYRNSKAKDIILILKELGSELFIFDSLLDDLTIEKNFGFRNANLDDIKNLDCVILISPHDYFKKITLDKLKNMMDKNPVLVDVKSFYDGKSAKEIGFSYRCL